MVEVLVRGTNRAEGRNLKWLDIGTADQFLGRIRSEERSREMSPCDSDEGIKIPCWNDGQSTVDEIVGGYEPHDYSREAMGAS